MATTSETSGKTGATPASASTPARIRNRPQQSDQDLDDHHGGVGMARRRMVGAIGLVSSMWVRASTSVGRSRALLHALGSEGLRA